MKPLALVPTLLLLLLTSRECFAAEVDVFVQKSWVIGSTRLTLAKDALKLEILDKQAVLISKAPSWQLVYISKLNHSYSISEPEKFHPPFSMTNALFRPTATNSMRVKSKAKASLSGYSCSKVLLVEGEDTKKESGDKTWKRLLAKSAELYVADLNYPLSISKALDQSFALPPVKGAPLAIIVTRHDGATNDDIKLISYKRKEQSKDEFDIPKSFARLASPEEVSKLKSQDDLQEFFH